ncbi:MAG: DUF2807 domain-containing protein [Paludibacter sp.]|jgi:phage shock protein PspC (stress-responsive transcriptional regulator)|nr:DUF2807 domain-containing protein [Paludibacter sp.]
MKRTLTVNLNSAVFNIDDDAYAVLDKYLKDIENHFAADEAKDEIIADIEARIAELFTDRLKSAKDIVKEVITVEDVNQIIATMGNPSQFSDGGDTPSDSKTANDEKKKSTSHRLYRDPENAMLGGVLAGIAAYFNMDKTILRLIYVVLTFAGLFAGFGWFMFVAYFVVWIIAPKAVSVAQRLEMRGEDVTVENIKSGFENAKEFVKSDEFKSNAKSIGERLADIFMTVVKIFGGIFGVIFGIVGFAIVAALIALLVAVIANPAISPDFFGGNLTTENGIMLLIASLLIVGCPVFSIIYWITRLLSQARAKSNTPLWISFILWLAGIFMLISVGMNSSILEFKRNQHNNWSVNFNREFFDETDENSPQITDTVQLAQFSKIYIAGAISATLTQDTVNFAIVSVPEQVRKNLIINTNNDKLKIHPQRGQWRGSQRIKIQIHSKNVNSLEISGASNLTASDTLRTDNLSIDVAGASKTEILVIAEKIRGEASGASKIRISGKTNSADFDASGASKIDSEKLFAKSVTVDASGASHANLFATESINAGASGASSIAIYGNPPQSKTTKSGASKINFE